MATVALNIQYFLLSEFEIIFHKIKIYIFILEVVWSPKISCILPIITSIETEKTVESKLIINWTFQKFCLISNKFLSYVNKLYRLTFNCKKSKNYPCDILKVMELHFYRVPCTATVRRLRMMRRDDSPTAPLLGAVVRCLPCRHRALTSTRVGSHSLQTWGTIKTL